MTATAWGKLDKSAAPSRWSEDRVAREIRAAVQGVAKAAGCTVRSMDIELITPVERAGATAAAADYERLAAVVSDPAQRENYGLLAKAERRKAGAPADRVAKAARYEALAAAVTDPATRRGYLELAAAERQRAG